jgi:acyl dehydratase
MAARTIERVEELKSLEGEEVGVSDWFEVTQERIDQFADLTHDRQWIHVDPERAVRESPYKATVAHGFFSLSLISMLSKQVVVLRGDFQRLINYGLNKVRFPAPVPAGARIRGRFTLDSVREFAGGIQIVWRVAIEHEGGEKPCVVAEWVTRAYR